MLGDEGVIAICHAVMGNTTLHVLDLRKSLLLIKPESNQIKGPGSVGLAEMLQKNQTLETLELRNIK